MVGGGNKDCEYSMLAQCSVVNHHGNILYDKYVWPIDTVVNYRTKNGEDVGVKWGIDTHIVHRYKQTQPLLPHTCIQLNPFNPNLVNPNFRK